MEFELVDQSEFKLLGRAVGTGVGAIKNNLKYLKNIGLGHDERLRRGRNEIAAHTVRDPRRIDELTVRIHRGGMDGDDVADACDDWNVVEKSMRR